ARVDAHRYKLLRPGHHRAHDATARAGIHGLVLPLFLQLGHLVLDLLDTAQHLHRVFHSEDSFTRVTRPSKRRTTSRTKGSSSGLTTGLAAPPPGVVAPPVSRKR